MTRLVVIGLGNIGSHLTMLLAPMLAMTRIVAELVLVDHDHYEARNLGTQAIERRDIGRNKAKAQARRLRRLHPTLRVKAHACRFEDLPLGELQADVVMTCLDAPAARVAVNQRLCRLGVPLWIDAGVSPDDRLARLSVLHPGLADQACYECDFTEAHYLNLEVRHPCADADSIPTGAPAALGALAASLQAIECEKNIPHAPEQPTAGKEIIVSGRWHTHFVSTLKRRATCRFDHQQLLLEPVEGIEPENLSWGDFFARVGPACDFSLRAEGTTWLTTLMCASCRRTQDTLVLRGRGLAEAALCRECGGRLHPSGFHARETMSRDDFSPAQLALPLSAAGVLPREILTFTRNDNGTNRSLLLHHAC